MAGISVPTLPPGIIVSAALSGILAVLLCAVGWRAWKARLSPAEAERRRRAALKATGKMGDATLVEIRDSLLFYCYDVRGVEYTASQDVSSLTEYLPAESLAELGSIYVKYDPKNPANSMILSEGWSGFRPTGFPTFRPKTVS